ncbi:MAG: MBL fold metallo-hydrolase [Thermodesulfobacteriota bacterium]|nr:MBL fold metallo-hydrolase [Thermodesulfobacteriota bacterium]
MNPVRLFILCDNTAHDPDFGYEWGLSVAVRFSEGDLWLWDTGQTDIFLDNAQKFGLDLGQAKGLALSHGHYDHTGGLPFLLGRTSFRGPIFAHPRLGERRYSIRPQTLTRFIGLDKGPLPSPLPNFQGVPQVRELTPGLTMLTSIPRKQGLFQAVGGFYFDEHGKKPDLIEDDACLVLETGSGPILILGCCHSGLGNTLLQVREVLGLSSLFAVLGGMHLASAPDSALEEAVQFLEDFDVRQVFPGHCTGQGAASYLKEKLPGRVFDLGSGLILDF